MSSLNTLQSNHIGLIGKYMCIAVPCAQDDGIMLNNVYASLICGNCHPAT